jgi:hypothetical protein
MSEEMKNDPGTWELELGLGSARLVPASLAKTAGPRIPANVIEGFLSEAGDSHENTRANVGEQKCNGHYDVYGDVNDNNRSFYRTVVYVDEFGKFVIQFPTIATNEWLDDPDCINCVLLELGRLAYGKVVCIKWEFDENPIIGLCGVHTSFEPVSKQDVW